MAKIEFIFKEIKFLIQCGINDKMGDIYKEFNEIIGKNIKNTFLIKINA